MVRTVQPGCGAGTVPPVARPKGVKWCARYSRDAAPVVKIGEPPGTRTPNPQIKSLLLYQLS